jgi:hypothetical protein
VFHQATEPRHRMTSWRRLEPPACCCANHVATTVGDMIPVASPILGTRAAWANTAPATVIAAAVRSTALLYVP